MRLGADRAGYGLLQNQAHKTNFSNVGKKAWHGQESTLQRVGSSVVVTSLCMACRAVLFDIHKNDFEG